MIGYAIKWTRKGTVQQARLRRPRVMEQGRTFKTTVAEQNASRLLETRTLL